MTDTLAMEPRTRYQREVATADETIHGRIHMLRGQKVMLDRDLAELYGVPVKRLKEQVRRNMNRFPEDFMFELTLEEDRSLRAQFVILKQEAGDDALGPEGVSRSQIATLKQGQNVKYAPFAFTEHGILMLANSDVLRKLEQLEGRITGHDEEIQALFDHLTALVSPVEPPRKVIGFKPDDA